MAVDALARAIRQGRGLEPCDLVIKGVQLLDIISGDLQTTDIGICDDRIVGTLASYDGRQTINGRGLVAVPGFIDTHLHVESSLVTPLEFDRCVLPHGVTTAICDPHEIANVCGMTGIRYFLDCARQTIMDLRVQLSSCVPATAFETAGARLEIDDLLPIANDDKVIGLAEFMNFPGVLAQDEAALAKLVAFQGRHIDGHCPLLGGRDLNGYLAAGILTDHEATSAEEGREKLRKGMTIQIREGSVSKDLDALAPLIDADSCSFLAFCTDDRNPLDIAEEGHIDSMIRRCIAKGAQPHHVYRMASWSGARAFGLGDRGMLAPGRRADIVLLSDLDACTIEHVISAGRHVDDALFAIRRDVAPVALGSVRRKPVTAAELNLDQKGQARVIGVVPGRIITEDLALSVPDPSINRVAVIARHGENENIGLGCVHGFALARGAIASSVGHDSHNITVVGADPEAMARAANRVIDMQGGFVVAGESGIEAELALPLAGLMSLEPFEHVHDALLPLRAAARRLGCTLPEPFLQVAFLPLPVIPHLKITDFGLFDVNRFELVTT